LGMLRFCHVAVCAENFARPPFLLFPICSFFSLLFTSWRMVSG